MKRTKNCFAPPQNLRHIYGAATRVYQIILLQLMSGNTIIITIIYWIILPCKPFLFMQRLFTGIYRYFEKHKTVYWLCFILCFGLSIAGALRASFEEDIQKAIPQNPQVTAMNKILSKTQAGSRLIFTLSFKDSALNNPDSLILIQNQLQQNLSRIGKGYIQDIQSQVNDDQQQKFIQIALQHLPLLLTDSDYAKIETSLNPDSITSLLQKERKLLLSPAGMIAAPFIASDPLGMNGMALEKFKALRFDPSYQLYDGYFFNEKNKKLNFFLSLKYPPSETGKNGIFIDHLNHFLQQWNSQHPKIETLYFGGPAVAVGNAAQMKKDTILTLSITIVLLLALTFYIFRRKRAPVLLMLPVFFGGIFGLAMTTLLQDSISVIALGAGAIILGIAIDFSVHFMSHARTHPDMEENVRTLVFPLTLGAFTTIAAFYALRFADAPVLQDLGTFASFSLLGASLFTLTFLPHLLKKIAGKEQQQHKYNLIDRLASFRPEGNKWLLILMFVATPILWHFAKNVPFDSDLMHLNYMSPNLEKAQQEIEKDNAFALSSMFIVAEGKTEDEAAEKLATVSPLIQSLGKQKKIRQSLNPINILPSTEEQLNKIKKWNHFWSPEKKNRVLELIKKESIHAGFSPHAFDAFQNTLNRGYQPYNDSTKEFIKNLLPNAYGHEPGKSIVIASLKVEPGARKAVLASFEQHHQVMATDRQAVSETLLKVLNNDFNKIFYISGLIVFIALLLAYGRIELALISFLPMALTWVWILGFMDIFGLSFNFVNVIIATLIFGLGDDYSIFMMDGLLEKYRTGKNQIRSARSAVYLSVLTTIVGLGTLIFAQHPALKSIAFISILGLVCVVFVSQVIQPFLFNFLIQKRADKGFMPFTLWSLMKSTFSFFYFFTGCLLLTIIGAFLVGLKPFGKKRSKFYFHYLISCYTKSLIYIMANVRKKVEWDDSTVLKQPAVVIANHSSFLDILIMTMLYPKVVLMTNKWVWRSPVFGKIVQMADYYPVMENVSENIEKLKSLTQDGYSIVVFPEGTRSLDGEIRRFHKGAFFLAKELQLPIIPVVLHGIHYTMQKGDWLLKDGQLNIYAKSALALPFNKQPVSYQEATKMAHLYYKNQLQQAQQATEDGKYFKEQLLKSYLYKGPILEWYCRIKARMEGYYHQFDIIVPEHGKIYDLGCGYGFLSWMLYWTAPERQIIGIDYDEEKIETATHNYNIHAVKEQTIPPKFEHADLSHFTPEKCNAILICDALHYLVPEKQNALLERCWEALLPGGTLIIRDGVTELKQRHRKTKLTELFSTRLLQFNKTKNELHFLSKEKLRIWAKEKNMTLEILENDRITSNLIFIFRKQED